MDYGVRKPLQYQLHIAMAGATVDEIYQAAINVTSRRFLDEIHVSKSTEHY
ncbi:MAG: hypothetical protein MZV64_14145 [Ignavibacteriales bacterium]|nr:hypothetical protein [Ignavibacteriales bacterium]